MIKFFERRRYFVNKYYRSVVLHANNENELEEIDKIITKNKFYFETYGHLSDIKPSGMSYEYDLNGFCIQDSNIGRFRGSFDSFINNFKEKSLDKSFEIFKYELFTINNMVSGVKVYINSFENIKISKQWFDYYFASEMKHLLKNYNNRYKKTKHVNKK